jgi:hypothetical protein
MTPMPDASKSATTPRNRFRAEVLEVDARDRGEGPDIRQMIPVPSGGQPIAFG